MVEEVRKTQLLVGVASLGRQQLRLKAPEQFLISLQQKRVVVGKVKEQMKQLPLEGGRSSEMEGEFSYKKLEYTPRTRKKRRRRSQKQCRRREKQ